MESRVSYSRVYLTPLFVAFSGLLMILVFCNTARAAVAVTSSGATVYVKPYTNTYHGYGYRHGYYYGGTNVYHKNTVYRAGNYYGGNRNGGVNRYGYRR